MASNDESIESLKKKNAEMLAQIAAMRKRIIPNLRPTSIRASRPSTEIIKTRLDEVGVLYRQEVAEIPSPMATDKDLRFDYFIDQLHLAIEFDGAQHYHSVGLWGGEDELAMRRIYDKAKDEWCIQHHISMLRVPYDLDVAEIISWVDKALTEAYSTDKPFIWLVSPKSKKLVSFQDRYAGVPSLRDGKIVSSNTEDPVVSAFSNVAPMMVNKALNNQEASEVLDKELRDAGITLTADQNEVYLVFLAFTIYLQHQANKTEPPKITFANFKFFMRNKGYKMGQHTVDVRAIARDLTTPYPLPVNSLTEDYESVFWYLDRKTAKKNVGNHLSMQLPAVVGDSEVNIPDYFESKVNDFASYVTAAVSKAPWPKLGYKIHNILDSKTRAYYSLQYDHGIGPKVPPIIPEPTYDPQMTDTELVTLMDYQFWASGDILHKIYTLESSRSVIMFVELAWTMYMQTLTHAHPGVQYSFDVWVRYLKNKGYTLSDKLIDCNNIYIGFDMNVLYPPPIAFGKSVPSLLFYRSREDEASFLEHEQSMNYRDSVILPVKASLEEGNKEASIVKYIANYSPVAWEDRLGYFNKDLQDYIQKSATRFPDSYMTTYTEFLQWRASGVKAYNW